MEKHLEELGVIAVVGTRFDQVWTVSIATVTTCCKGGGPRFEDALADALAKLAASLS
jgi:hypothetical protein